MAFVHHGRDHIVLTRERVMENCTVGGRFLNIIRMRARRDTLSAFELLDCVLKAAP